MLGGTFCSGMNSYRADKSLIQRKRSNDDDVIGYLQNVEKGRYKSKGYLGKDIFKIWKLNER